MTILVREEPVRRALSLAPVILLLSSPLVADDRVAVRVVDPAGERPLAGGGVACADPAGPGATVGLDGRIPVLGSCKKVRCWADGYLPGEVEVRGSAVDCRVTGAARIEGPVSGLTSAEGMEGRLYTAGTKELAAREALVGGDRRGQPPRVALGPVACGQYRLDLVRVSDGWTCRADLGLLPHGIREVAPIWRSPGALRGSVVDEEGQPVEKIAVRVWNEFPEIGGEANRRPPRVDPIGLWSCGPSAPLKGVTGADGGFSFPSDSDGEVLVAAGSWDDPLGVAARSFPELPGESVVLRPERPVTLLATVVDEDDRPVECRAALTVRSPESAWLAKLLPGSTLEGPCAGDGSLRLGPFLSSDWELYVRPKAGLPVRMRGDAPVPGTIENLGRVRVARGTAVSVDVFDAEGGAVEGARVLGSGSAGLVFNVEAFTDVTGRAELSGFPDGALLRVEASADGYRTRILDGLDIVSAPVRIELERASIVEGEVVGQSGETVPGAQVMALSESGDLAGSATSDSQGAFRISDAAPGAIRLIASARGYRRGEPVPITVEPGDERYGVTLTLARAKGVRGRVVDPSGSPVPGARVVLAADQGGVRVDPGSALAVAVTDSEGRFTLGVDPQPRQAVVATAHGYGPAVESSPLAKEGSELVLTLAPAGAVEVILPADLPETRVVSLTDGRRVKFSETSAGRTIVRFSELAPGRGEASLPPGPRKPVEIVEGATRIVELRDGVTVEGTVTLDGRPLPNFVVAVVSLREGGIAMEGAVETDAEGTWRRENLAPGRTLFSAIGPEGRAEKRVDLPAEGSVRVNLEVSQLILDARVSDADSGDPVAGASLFLQPAGAACNASMSTRSWGNLFDTDVDISVSDGGCGFGSTSADGRARIVLASAGTATLHAHAKRYESVERPMEIREGVNAVSVALEPVPAPRVRVALRTDPPGLPGTLECVMDGGGTRHSYGGVSGTQECPVQPGPAEVIFRVDGYGIGRTEFVVPEEGDLDVTVTAVRCGQLLIARGKGAEARPVVRSADGVDWAGVLFRTAGGAMQAVDTVQIGEAWLLRYLPPGPYTVELEGTSLGTVTIEPGSTATIP